MARPKISILDPWDARWVALTLADPEAHIFHHPAWSSLLANCYGYRPFVMAIRDTDDNICAGLPMMEVARLLTGRFWISLPFTDHCAPLQYSAESRSSFINSLVHLSQEQGTPKIELHCEFPHDPAIRSYSQQVLHTLHLCPDSESVASRFHSTHRRNINVAQKRGVRVEWGTKREHLEAFYLLHLQTRRRQGIPIQPWRFFDLLASSLIEQDLGFVLLAFKDDECLAAAVFLHWQQTLTYKYGASAVNSLSLRPNNLLFWTAIRWGCENGYTVFDMGKTDLANTGLRAFKSGWGAEELPLTYLTTSKENQNRVSMYLSNLMKPIIQRSPLWVCRLAGECLYKYAG